MDLRLFFWLKGLMLAPLVLGFNNGIILSESANLNSNVTSASVFLILKIRLGSISLIALIILFPRPMEGIYACNTFLP